MYIYTKKIMKTEAKRVNHKQAKKESWTLKERKETHQSNKAGAKEEKDFNSQEWKHKIKVTKLKNRELTRKSKRVNTRGKQTERGKL